MNVMNLDLVALLNRSLAPKLLCAFFGLLLLLSLFQLRSLVGPEPIASAPALAVAPAETNVLKLLEIPLFGQYVTVMPPAAGMKPSTLSVELMGIMYANKPSESQVLIRLNNGEEHSYFIGDNLPGGAVIKRIKPDKTIILYQGSLEVLTLPKKSLQFEKPEKPLLTSPKE